MNDLATAIGTALGREVTAVPVARDKWTATFEASGMPVGRTGPRAEMVDGFNSGWIEFEGEPLRGSVALDQVMANIAKGGRN